MTPHDADHEDSDPRPESAARQPTSPPDPADSTGTWAFVSPFASSPESYGPAPDGGAPAPPTWGAAAPPTWGVAPAPSPDGRPRRGWQRWQKVAAGGALAAVVAAGGVAAVSAANASSDDTSAQAGPGGAPGFGGGDTGQAGPQGDRGGAAAMMELANALHGDVVVADGDGTRTVRLQTGQITALTGDSVTVTSTDGYASTYAVGSGVDLSTAAAGDTVRVIGTVNGDVVTATSVQTGSAAAAGFGPGRIAPGQGSDQGRSEQGGEQPGGAGAPGVDGQTPPTS